MKIYLGAPVLYNGAEHHVTLLYIGAAPRPALLGRDIQAVADRFAPFCADFLERQPFGFHQRVMAAVPEDPAPFAGLFEALVAACAPNRPTGSFRPHITGLVTPVSLCFSEIALMCKKTSLLRFPLSGETNTEDQTELF